MSDESEGLPLAEALRAYGDPELWAAYESARTALKRIPDRPPWLHSSREARDEWLNRYEGAAPTARAALDTARQALELDFTTRLQRRELVATGIKRPFDETSQRIVVPANMWSMLTPDFARSSAKDPDIEFVNVRVWKDCKSIGPDPAQALATEEEVRKPVRTRTAKRRGPASLMDPIRAKMKARAECGKLRGKFSEESAYLEQWAKHEFPDFPRTPKAKSIREALREEYHKLRASYLTGI